MKRSVNRVILCGMLVAGGVCINVLPVIEWLRTGMMTRADWTEARLLIITGNVLLWSGVIGIVFEIRKMHRRRSDTGESVKRPPRW